MIADTSLAINCTWYCKIADSNGDYETYWYGTYSNGYSIYTPGSVMTLHYNGYYDEPGFQLVFYPADPGKVYHAMNAAQLFF